MPPVDAFATYPHYRDHIQPVWDALENKGTFYTSPLLGGPHVTKGLRDGPPVIVAGYPDLRRSRHRQHIFIEHGAGENWGGYDPHYSGGLGRESVILFLCPNERVAEANRSRYAADAVVVGSPRVEYLASLHRVPSHDRLRVVVSFHWDCRTWANTTSALPHFQQFFGAWQRDIEIRGHAHPRIIDRAEKAFARAGIQTIRRFEDVIRWADIYACDNSSTIFEAAACGLKVILLDAPWFVPDPESLRFGKFSGIGPHVTGDELPRMAMLLNDMDVSYDEMVTEIFGTLDGSAERAARAIEAVTNDNSGPEGSTPGSAARTIPSQPSLFGGG